MKIFSNSSARTAAGRLALTAALAAMPILTACGGQTHQKGPAPQTIQVHLNESSIQLPASVPAGSTTFEVINDGTTVHGFQIEGPGGDKQVPPVEPGKSASLKIDLDPGTYRVLSPIDAEKNQNMVKALSVTQS
jgi:iron uptake system component EfeO